MSIGWNRESLFARSVIAAAGCCAALTTTVSAQDGRAGIVVTDEHGASIVPAHGPWSPSIPFSQRATLWTYDNGFLAIPQNVAFSPGRLWVGQALNNEVLQTFDVPGDGTVANSFPTAVNSVAAVSAASGADLAVMADGPEYVGPFTLRAYTASGPTWTYDFPAPYMLYSNRFVSVSRDGSTVAVAGSYYDQDLQQAFARVDILNGDGSHRSTWEGSGGMGGVELSDDGARCLVSNDSNGRLIETAGGTETNLFFGSGGGAFFRISGNGRTVALGGFSFAVWTEDGGNWTNTVNYSAPTQWFGWGTAVSRDGATVACITHDYGASYLNTRTRAWDVASGAMLGEYETLGGGNFQDSAAGAAMSDDGSIFAVASWGDEIGTHPEVMIFDRSVNLIGSVDTRGSVFALAMSPDGRYVASGCKAAHANSFGNGGDVTLYETESPCAADFNGDDFLDFFDYADYVLCFEEGTCPEGRTADFNGDDFVDFFDYSDYVAAFEAGC